MVRDSYPVESSARRSQRSRSRPRDARKGAWREESRANDHAPVTSSVAVSELRTSPQMAYCIPRTHCFSAQSGFRLVSSRDRDRGRHNAEGVQGRMRCEYSCLGMELRRRGSRELAMLAARVQVRHSIAGL